MFGLFKLKKKSKKEKNQDDEKENTSSPTKVKKVDNNNESKKSKKNSKSSDNNGESNKSADSSSPNKNKSSPKIVNSNETTIKIDIISSKPPVSPITNGHATTSQHRELTVDTNNLVNRQYLNETQNSTNLLQPSPLSTKSAASTLNTQQQQQQRVFSASDAAHTTSFVRGNFLSSTISGSDLNRFINSGYLHNGDNYLQRGVDLKTPKSPHFHRPPNFSYSKMGPNYVTPQQQRSSAHRASTSSGDAPRYIVNSSTNSSGLRGRSTSPNYFQQKLREQSQTITTTNPIIQTNLITTTTSDSPVQVQVPVTTTTVEEQPDGTITTITTITRTPVIRMNDTEEPIRLSKFAGGFEPNPDQPAKIESLDWPSPPCLAAMPELRANGGTGQRSRSSSNRRAPSTVQSVHGNASGVDVVDHIENINENSESSDEDDQDLVHDEEVQQCMTMNNNNNNGGVGTIQSNQTNTTHLTNQSVSSSLARVRAASRPSSKLKYQNNLFDNDYNDYMLRYKSDKEWRKMLDQNKRHQSGESNNTEIINNNYGELITNNNNNNGDYDNNDYELELQDNDDDYDENDDEETKLEKLKRKQQNLKETDELERFRNESKSSMAAELLGEVKAAQKIITHKLKIDPWKASRSPNAKAEPSVRTRYESPVNASPSRVFNYNSNTGRTTTTLPNDMSTSSSGHLMLSMTPTPGTHSANLFENNDHVDHSSFRTPPPTLIRNQCISSNSRIISSSSVPKAVPKPGYGLSSANRSVTLPNTARYDNGLLSNRSFDYDYIQPHYVSAHSYYLSRDLYTPTPIDPNKLNEYRSIIATRSTPNLIGEPKVYPYEVLRVIHKKKLPADVDRERLERHLSPDEFEMLFQMNIQQFNLLPEWKRVDLKKQLRLF